MFELHPGCTAAEAVEESCGVPDLLHRVTGERLFYRIHGAVRGKPVSLSTVLQLIRYLQEVPIVFQGHYLL